MDLAEIYRRVCRLERHLTGGVRCLECSEPATCNYASILVSEGVAYCERHAKFDMESTIPEKHKGCNHPYISGRRCMRRAVAGPPGEKPDRCRIHFCAGRKYHPLHICIMPECSQLAVCGWFYGMNAGSTCEDHCQAYMGTRNIVLRDCPDCKIPLFHPSGHDHHEDILDEDPIAIFLRQQENAKLAENVPEEVSFLYNVSTVLVCGSFLLAANRIHRPYTPYIDGPRSRMIAKILGPAHPHHRVILLIDNGGSPKKLSASMKRGFLTIISNLHEGLINDETIIITIGQTGNIREYEE